MVNIFDKAASWLLSKVSNNFVFAEYYKRSSGKPVDYTRQAVQLNRKEIEDYIRAVMFATDPEDPRLGDWMRFRQNMKLDSHLVSCVENRTLPVKCAPFKLTDKNDNEAPKEIKKLLEKPWMLDAYDLVLSHIYEGPKLLCMYELNENGELTKIEEVPQSNFIPQKGIVLVEESDNEGVSYRDGVYKNYYFQVGNDWELGLFSMLANVVLAKKLALGSWISYIEKYGVPPIFAITERMDTTRRDELFEMLLNFRMNHFAVLQGNEKIETPQGYNVDAYNTFKSLMTDICDNAISKGILGSSGMTEEKSFVGAAQVQERILAYRHKVDKLIFKYYFNEEIKPRLVKLSPVYAPLENLTFEYDEAENLTMKEYIDAVKDLSIYFNFDVEELKKVTGLPVTTIKNTLGVTDPEPTVGQKKKPDARSFSLLAPFAYTAPDIRGGGLNKAGGLAVIPVYAATWNDSFDKIIEGIREGKINPDDLDKDFILKTYDRLNKAAGLGYGKDYYSDDNIARKMRQNLLEFAATKTHVQQHEVQLLNNSIDNKKQYTEEAKKYLDLQNGNYLDVQAAWAARKAQAARQYQDWQKDKDIYQRVKFRTMNDNSVRPEHAALDGLVLNIDSPDLSLYMTPLGPSCRCWWEQTFDRLTDWKPEYTPDLEWLGNTGIDGLVFNEHNSYNKQVENNETRREIRRQAELAKEYMPYNRVIEAGNNKVYINDFADPADLKQNVVAAKKMARSLDTDIYIRPHINVDGYKNPELGIGEKNQKADLKTFLLENKGTFEGFIKNSISSAYKQKAKTVVIDISQYQGADYHGWLVRKLSGELKAGYKKGINSVVIIKGDKAIRISRSDINNKDFSKLEEV
jgi:SPP1 gp7 family putative phage head morphogenesis protein